MQSFEIDRSSDYDIQSQNPSSRTEIGDWLKYFDDGYSFYDEAIILDRFITPLVDYAGFDQSRWLMYCLLWQKR